MRKELEINVRTRKIPLKRESAKALSIADSYDWVLFTSRHAVEHFVEECRIRHIHLHSGPRIAAVGPTTAGTLRTFGFQVDIVPKQFTSRDLVRALGTVKGQRILFPRSAIAPTEALAELRRGGARVRAVPLYKTEVIPLTKSEREDLLSGAYKQILFKSPSGVRGLMAQLKPTERRFVCTIAARCIGETTATQAREAGFKNVRLGRIL